VQCIILKICFEIFQTQTHYEPVVPFGTDSTESDAPTEFIRKVDLRYVASGDDASSSVSLMFNYTWRCNELLSLLAMSSFPSIGMAFLLYARKLVQLQIKCTR